MKRRRPSQLSAPSCDEGSFFNLNKEDTMDYFRFGTCAGWDAPGGNLLLGLMRQLSTSRGMAEGQLLLAEGHMDGGLRSLPAVNACEMLVYVLDGAVRVRVVEEEVNLIAGDAVRVPAGSRYELSTERSAGMTALLILPLPSATARPEDGSALPACYGGDLSLKEDPRSLPFGALDLLASLTRLVGDGCAVPMVALARGGFNRDVIFASLLPQYAADPLALRALLWLCNAHPAACWWLNRARAKTALEEGVKKLLKS